MWKHRSQKKTIIEHWSNILQSFTGVYDSMRDWQHTCASLQYQFAIPSQISIRERELKFKLEEITEELKIASKAQKNVEAKLLAERLHSESLEKLVEEWRVKAEIRRFMGIWARNRLMKTCKSLESKAMDDKKALKSARQDLMCLRKANEKLNHTLDKRKALIVQLSTQEADRQKDVKKALHDLSEKESTAQRLASSLKSLTSELEKVKANATITSKNLETATLALSGSRKAIQTLNFNTRALMNQRDEERILLLARISALEAQLMKTFEKTFWRWMRQILGLCCALLYWPIYIIYKVTG